MIWLTYRQFRAQAITALAVLGVAVVYLIVTGLSMHHTYAVDLAACAPQHNCDNVLEEFRGTYDRLYTLMQYLMLIAPGLIGIFWGAPLIGRELETGTHQLAWSQTVTRTRWLAAKLAGVGGASIAAAALLGYLLAWWSGPLDQIAGNRFGAATFVTHDIVPIGYAAFSFALGATLGLVLRRTLAAMAVTIAVFIGIQILMPAVVRPHLISPTTATFPVDQATAAHVWGFYEENGGVYLGGLPVPPAAWVLSTSPMEDSAGRVVPLSAHLSCFHSQVSAASATGDSGPDIEQLAGCLAQYDLHEDVTYQPVSHYWALQRFETGIFVALAAALSGFCFWRIRRRQS